MSRSTVLTSFAELADVLDLTELPNGPSTADPVVTAPAVDGPHSASNPHDLHVQLQTASGTLAAIAPIAADIRRKTRPCSPCSQSALKV